MLGRRARRLGVGVPRPASTPGKGHLKNKFCRNCTRHGVYIDARRVRAVDGDINDFPEFGNARGVGVWTTDPTARSGAS